MDKDITNSQVAKQVIGTGGWSRYLFSEAMNSPSCPLIYDAEGVSKRI